jgi:hypothetical protein
MAVVAGWRAIAGQLKGEGSFDLAEWVTRFAEQMPSPTTDQVQMAPSVGLS